MKVYVAVPTVAVLITAGDHVPVMPLAEINGNTPGVAFKQYGPNCVKLGVTLLDTTMVMLVGDPH